MYDIFFRCVDGECTWILMNSDLDNPVLARFSFFNSFDVNVVFF